MRIQNITTADNRARFARGFTIVELISVVAIMLLMSSLVLVGYNNFRGSVLLTNLAYDVGLSIRTAQTYGLGVREALIAGSDFDTGYGVHFDPESSDTYLLFADRDRNFAYDGSGELVETFTLRGGYSIASVCATPGNGSEDCNVGALDAVFDRPEPDAIIRDELGTEYASMRITISSTQGSTRDIVVTAAGQISVERNGESGSE